MILNNIPPDPMNPASLHALQIATLAAWVSSGVGAVVGFAVPQTWHLPVREKPLTLQVQSFVNLEAPTEQDSPTEANTESPAQPESQPVNAPATPPPMPEIVTMNELPDIPDLPAPVIRKTAQKVAAPTTTREPTTPRPQTSANKPASPQAKPASTPPSSATSLSFGSGAGRQPAPAYPLQARRSNQQGTVTVEFLVGTDGKVLSAWVKNPSPYPVLDNAALSTVRSRWKFPAGAARRYRIPIVFRLN